MKRFLIVVACSLLWITSAQAQTCAGLLPFSTAPIQVGAGATFSSNTHGVAVGAAGGNESYFGRAGFDITGFSGIDSAKGIFGAAGADFKVEAAAKPISICPMVSLAKLWGPSPAPQLSLSSFLISAGAAVGFVATQAGQATIVPTAGLAFNYVNTSVSSQGPGPSGSGGSSFGSLQLGAGFLFSDRYSLVPSLIVPFGYDVGEVSFSILFGAKIGS